MRRCLPGRAARATDPGRRPGRFSGRRSHHALAAGAAMVGLTTVGLPTAAPARPAAPAAPAALSAAPGVRVTPVRGAVVATVPLITGDQVMVTATAGGSPSYLLRPAAAGRDPALWYQGPGGDRFVVPVIALPYVGRELGRSLFDVSALARDGIRDGARIP